MQRPTAVEIVLLFVIPALMVAAVLVSRSDFDVWQYFPAIVSPLDTCGAPDIGCGI